MKLIELGCASKDTKGSPQATTLLEINAKPFRYDGNFAHDTQSTT